MADKEYGTVREFVTFYNDGNLGGISDRITRGLRSYLSSRGIQASLSDGVLGQNVKDYVEDRAGRAAGERATRFVAQQVTQGQFVGADSETQILLFNNRKQIELDSARADVASALAREPVTQFVREVGDYILSKQRATEAA